jgi:hypothetical protein
MLKARPPRPSQAELEAALTSIRDYTPLDWQQVRNWVKELFASHNDSASKALKSLGWPEKLAKLDGSEWLKPFKKNILKTLSEANSAKLLTNMLYFYYRTPLSQNSLTC